jgi:hypothetical protein
MKGRDHSEDLGADGRRIVSVIKKWGQRAWIGFIWLRIRTNGGLL